MVVPRPVLAAAGCSQCRLHILRLFTGSSLRSSPIARRSSSCARIGAVGALPIRRFLSLSRLNSSVSDAKHGEDARAAGEDPEHGEGEGAANESRPNDIPWYLQVESPAHIVPLEPPPLPETPPDAPPLIGSLLEYASEEMGLDALNLLDLRKLDPSPALGPNLFMLFGTARSERHLNVSAGRLVRWLRAKHRVHANADGLLGPNERKTKLRRKAKRAKLLGTMGTDDADDGIRTGWICVNLGDIDSGGAESAVVAEDGRISGFGMSQPGSTVVFQIMTEDRRAEMGLETLWTQALDRSLSPTPKSDATSKDGDSTSRTKPGNNLHPVEKAITAGLHRPSGFPSSRKGQSSGVSSLNQARFYSIQLRAAPSSREVDPLSTSSPEELARVLTYDAHQKQRLLELLRTQLDDMDARAALIALGESRDGHRPTPFMELMELAMQTLPPTRTWEYRLAIQYKASVSGVPKAVRSLDNVRLLIEELRIYGIEATRHQYLQLLSCVFYTEERQPSTVIKCALDVVHTMHQRNESVMVNDLLVTMIEAASKGNDKRRWVEDLVMRLETLLFQPDSLCMDEQLIMRLMRAHVHQGNWDGVWRAWGVPARHLRPRSADMYICIFELAFASRSSELCAQVLRRCIPESNSEDPPVLSDIRVQQAALECIRIADGQAEKLSELNPADTRGNLRRLALGEFAKLRRLLTSSTQVGGIAP